MLINNEPIDIQTINMLKRNSKYKLFKFDFEIDTLKDKRLQVFYQMLDELPELEISRISASYPCGEFLNILLQKQVFKTKKEFLKVLEFDDLDDIDPPDQSEPHEYLAMVRYPECHDMS